MKMAKKSKLVVFNWKENPQTLSEASRLFAVVEKVSRYKGRAEIVVCPPVLYLGELSRKSTTVARLSLGAQNTFWENGGAYTGEVGPLMLRCIGKNVRYSIVGHSERRRYARETDEMVNEKVRAALAAGLRVILCVGEPADVRRRGIRAARQFVKDQLRKDLRGLSMSDSKKGSLTVAYEPIWAISTGRNADPEDVRDVAIFIKKETHSFLGIKIIYGGSVDGSNIDGYLCYNEIDGFLSGGASLRPKEIIKIVKKVL